jgi:hypothetical protein
MMLRLRLRLRTALLALLVGVVLALPARAHEISMAEMELRQMPSGEFLWQWTAGQRSGVKRHPELTPWGCGRKLGLVKQRSRGSCGVRWGYGSLARS